MIIRRVRPGDAETVRALLTSAFADDGRVAKLADALSARPDCPCPALVAEADGTPVGYVQLSRGWVDAAERLVEVLVLSPLGVARSHQRRGIGRALCEAAADQARQLDAPALFLEGDPAYYARLGWERAADHGFTSPSSRIPDAAFQVQLLAAWQPWMTGRLVYNDTFWDLDCVGLRVASAGMDSEANKALVRRFYDEVWASGNVGFAAEVFRDDYMRHDLRPTQAEPGAAGQARIAEQFRRAFPDVDWHVDFVLGERDLVAARWTATGTHTGPWGDLAPTGKRASFSGVNIFRFDEGGKVVEIWNHRDDLGLMQQLGGAAIFAGAPSPAGSDEA